MRKQFTHREPIILPKLTAVQLNGARWYEVPSGTKYKSVSTLMSSLSNDSIMEWKRRVGEEEANKISKRATTFGTAIHKIIEDYIDNKEEYIDFAKPEEKWVFNSVKEYIDRIDSVYCQEAELYSDVLRLAGRTDCIAQYEGVDSIIDFKTARKMKKESYIESYFLQTTCYSLMFEERTGIKIPQIVIILMTYTGEIQVFKKQRKDYFQRLKEVLQNEFRRN